MARLAGITFHIQDPNGLPIPGALMRAMSTQGDWAQYANACGDCFVMLAEGHYDATISAPGFKDRVYPMDLGESGTVLIGLDLADVPPLGPWVHPRGAFCIPGAFAGAGIPYGDGMRIWDPAFACYEEPDKIRILRAHLDRGHNTLEYQVSGSPYHGDYPEIPLNEWQTQSDLTLIRQHGLQTMIAFDDTRWPDLSYLEPVARLTQGLVDCVMGIYEVNGVTKDLDAYFSILQQSKALWPKAKHAVHLLDVMGGESYGFFTPDGWAHCKELGLDMFLCQCAGWRYNPTDVAARIADYTRRLGGPGMHGFPTLSEGVVQFEMVTTELYHAGWTEQQGIDFCDSIRRQVPGKPDGQWVSVPVTGFMDSGQDPT